MKSVGVTFAASWGKTANTPQISAFGISELAKQIIKVETLDGTAGSRYNIVIVLYTFMYYIVPDTMYEFMVYTIHSSYQASQGF